MGQMQSQIRGCLLGMAVGDAMGHTVDNRSLAEIREDYGPNGLLGYDLVNGYAEITSYTQIAAFSANGLLLGLTRAKLQGRMAPPVRYIGLGIKEWSRSQQFGPIEKNFCWLSREPEMKRRYCMDTRMLDALNREVLGTPEAPQYKSNHPGGLTMVVPVALLSQELKLSGTELDRLGAEAVAMTHGEPEAFISGAVLTHILRHLMDDPEQSLQSLLRETVDTVGISFGRDYGESAKVWELLQLAVTLSMSDRMSADAMETLGCRTAAEVLAGAVYAVLTCGGDFDTAMITAVNHSGRSAAVGAITGCLLGVILGEKALPEFYLESLEPAGTLMELADDLTAGCPMVAGSNLFDDDWDRKYLHAGA